MLRSLTARRPSTAGEHWAALSGRDRALQGRCVTSLGNSGGGDATRVLWRDCAAAAVLHRRRCTRASELHYTCALSPEDQIYSGTVHVAWAHAGVRMRIKNRADPTCSGHVRPKTTETLRPHQNPRSCDSTHSLQPPHNLHRHSLDCPPAWTPGRMHAPNASPQPALITAGPSAKTYEVSCTAP